MRREGAPPPTWFLHKTQAKEQCMLGEKGQSAKAYLELELIFLRRDEKMRRKGF